MAPVKGLNGRQLLAQIGDGGSPEVFAHDCLINSERGVQFGAEATNETMRDCTPGVIGWQETDVDGLSATITGAGKLHTPSVKAFFAWYTSGAAKNVRLLLNGIGLADGGGYWAGAFKLTAFEVTGPERGNTTVSLTLQSHGPVIWVDAAA